STERHQEPIGRFEPIGRRRLEPHEPPRIGHSPGMELEHAPAEIDALDLWGVRLLEPALFALGPEAYAATWARPPGASRPLVGRRLTDTSQFEAVETALWIDAGVPRQPAVDHSADPIDRQRSLGNICGKDDLAAMARPEGKVLLDRALSAVERQ